MPAVIPQFSFSHVCAIIPLPHWEHWLARNHSPASIVFPTNLKDQKDQDKNPPLSGGFLSVYLFGIMQAKRLRGRGSSLPSSLPANSYGQTINHYYFVKYYR